jgi:ribosomal peptide maturation radical SAM protein 1
MISAESVSAAGRRGPGGDADVRLHWPKVALVYPPFGPSLVPSLGLGILSAGIKALGFECRTFYWNLDVVNAIPRNRVDARLDAYTAVASLFPWSEWVFARELFPERVEDRERLLEELDSQDESRAWWKILGLSRGGARELVSHLRDRAAGLVEEMADRLDCFDLVGIGTTFFQSVPALALARSLKRRWPEKTIVLGGANCEGEMGRTLMEQFPFIDYVFSGEVDFSFPQFVRRLSTSSPVADLPGIVYREPGGGVRAGAASPPVEEMDRLPTPDFDDYFSELDRTGTLRLRGHNWITLESSRGCWWGAKHHCTFCALNAMGMGYRRKSPERFRSEVEEVVQRYGARSLFMADNILPLDYFDGFMDWAQRSGLHLNFFYELKANLNRKQVETLRRSGITWVQPGIESFSSNLLKLMDKGVRGIQNVALLKYMLENGVRATYLILGGFPGEDRSDYQWMAAEMAKLVHLEPPGHVCEIVFERFSPYHQAPERFGLELRPDRRYSALYPFGEETLTRLAQRFELVDPPSLSHLEPVKQAVARWRRKYYSTRLLRGRSSLSWKRDGDDVLIRDRRAGFPRRNYRLSRFAPQALLALDQPTTLRAVLRVLQGDRDVPDPLPTGTMPHQAPPEETAGGRLRGPLLSRMEVTVSFSREEFFADPEGCLAPLVKAGLIYVEDTWYLSLPVASHYYGKHETGARAIVSRFKRVLAGLLPRAAQA